jgi:UDP-N-acetylmuramoyl-L-alanyl-D-glutamate--2,6-diaminopimelate ligase
MEEYFQAKRKLFADLLLRSPKPQPRAVINVDDEYGRRLAAELGARAWGYGASDRAELSYLVKEEGFAGTKFVVRTPRGEAEIHLRMTGRHNIYNAMAAIGSALVAGIDLKLCAEALATLEGVSGRLQAVPNSRGIHVFVDYAHTDDALRTVLGSLNAVRKEAGLKNKIITVFGCGGDRDRGKRPLMMKEALAGSDHVVVTSDNPRTEDPARIIEDALSGAPDRSRVQAIVDRREGIREALRLAAPGDVVLIAGKGHEDYQQIGTVKYPFSDFAVVKEILQ